MGLVKMLAAFGLGALLLAGSSVAKEDINLGACYGYFNQMGVYILMAKLALDEGYFDDILPATANSNHFTVNVKAVNTLCSGSISTVKALPLLLGQGSVDGRIYSPSEISEPVVGIAGCTCSGATMPVSTMTTNYKVPMISGSATNPDLSDKGLYPYFSRVVPPDSMQGNGFAALVMEFNWKRVLSVYPAEPYAQGIATAFKNKMATTDTTVIEYQLPYQQVSEPAQAATFDHEQWLESALQVAKESPQPRVFFTVSIQIDHMIRIFYDIGLVSSSTLWMMGEGVCGIELLQKIGSSADAYKAADPEDTWWDFPWMDMPLLLKGMLCLTPKSIGAKYYDSRFQDFFAGVTRAKLESLGWDSTADGWEDDWLSATWFESLIYNPLAFDSMVPFIYAIGQMLSKGVAAADIKGDALHQELLGVTLDSVTGPLGFDANGDRLAPYTIYNMLDDNAVPKLVAIGEYNSITESISWSAQPIFADGTTNVPADRPESCQRGFEFGGTFEGCVACAPGKASVDVDSRCVVCQPGYYQDASGSSACEPAPKGAAVATNGSSIFSECSPGQFASEKGTTACTTCAAGTFASAPGMTLCENAAAGFFVQADGASSATPCAKGHFAAEEASLECTPCPAGTFAASTGMSSCTKAAPGSFVSGVGQVSSSLCTAGYYSAMDGAVSCTPCLGGFSQSAPGQTSCSRCEKGHFSEHASATCNRCYGAMTTESSASASQADCQCPQGQYCHGIWPSCDCRACPEGMECPFGAKQEALLPFDASKVPPLVKPGYYTAKDEPLSVYFCHPSFGEEACPGGPPERCLNNFGGITCAACPSGTAKKGDACEECSGGNTVVLVIVPICAVILGLVVYYSGNRQVETNSTIMLGVSVLAGLLVTIMQLFATFDQLTLPWPGGVKAFFGSAKFFVINPGTLSADCLDAAPSSQYLLRFLLPYVVVVGMGLLFLGAKGLAAAGVLKREWELAKVINSIFQIYQAIFIALTAISAVPFQCYSHPNGEKSLVQYPTVLCGSGDHSSMVAMSVILIVTFVLPFIGIQIWANMYIIRARCDAVVRKRHLTRFRFLMYRFRPDVWWWGTAFTVRQTLLAFAPMVEPDDPHAQSVFIIAVLVVYIANVCYFWPWKSDELNLLDAVSLVFIVMLVATVSSFMPASEWRDAHSMVMTAVLVFLTVVAVVGVIYGAVRLFGGGSINLTGIFGADEQKLKDKRRITDLTKELYDLAKMLGQAPSADLVEALLTMNSYDLRKIRGAIDAFKVCTVESVAGTPASLPMRLVGIPHSASAGAQAEVTKTKSQEISENVNAFKPNFDPGHVRQLVV